MKLPEPKGCSLHGQLLSLSKQVEINPDCFSEILACRQRVHYVTQRTKFIISRHSTPLNFPQSLIFLIQQTSDFRKSWQNWTSANNYQKVKKSRQIASVYTSQHSTPQKCTPIVNLATKKQLST